MKLLSVIKWRRILQPLAQHVPQHIQNLGLTAGKCPHERTQAILLGTLNERQQTSIPLSGQFTHLRIQRVKIINHGMNRRAHTIQIQPIKRRALLLPQPRIIRPQPANKIPRLLIPPHPRGKAAQRSNSLLLLVQIRFHRIAHRVALSHVSIDTLRVGPVGLDGDDVEAVMLDHVLRDASARGVELRGAVAGVPDQQGPLQPGQ